MSFLLLALMACVARAPVSEAPDLGPVADSVPRALVEPATLGLDAAALDVLISWAIESRTDALALVVGGTTVLHWPEEPVLIETMSMTKSFASLGIGMLLADGAIPSLDEPATTWFPRWEGTDHAAITLRNLLEHTSGLETRLSRDILAADDCVDFALDQALVSPPGEVWAYNNSGANLVAAVGSRAAGRPFDEYLDDRLFTPLGLGPRPWDRDRAGNTRGGAGLQLSADDLVTLGTLLLQDGQWEGEALVPADWIAESTAPNPHSEVFGLQWWALRRPVPCGEPECEPERVQVGFRADGWLGQVLDLVPPGEG